MRSTSVWYRFAALALGGIVAGYACGGDGAPPPPSEGCTVDAVTITTGDVTLASFNETATLTASVTCVRGGTPPAPTWSTSDAGIATVSAAGVVTAVGNGQATITASAGGQSGSISATVDQEPASIDMLGAVYLAREMVRTGVERLEFPLLDREDTWQVELRQGRRARREVPAGKYLCREVKMATRMEGAGGEEFEGLFGIQGTISIWLHAESGVPVEISGTVPLGPMKFEMSIGLRKAEGTPPGFE